MDLTELITPFFAVDPAWERVDITGITSDSHEVVPGVLFAALPGTLVDGAKFIPQAIDLGASAILTHPNAALPGDIQVPVLQHETPRHLLAKMASRFYSPQPSVIVGVTGTNGKTSVVSFVRQIWTTLGVPAASVGTIGIVAPEGVQKLAHTTPEPVTLHRALQQLCKQGVEHVALEVSSHGLAQQRLDGVHFQAAGFTNITRDHLDYHSSFEAYFAEKKKLFSQLLPEGSIGIIDADVKGAGEIIKIVESRMLNLMSVGGKGRFLRLINIRRDGYSQILTVMHEYGKTDIRLPLVGDFQVSNALIACALVAATDTLLLIVLPLCKP